MVVKLEGHVCAEMVDKLIEAENSCPHDDSLFVYLSTPGGSASDMQAIISIINESEKIAMLFCYEEVFSAGFIIAMSVQKPVEFLDDCLGMAHKVMFMGGKWTDELKVAKDVKTYMKLSAKNAKRLIEDLISKGIFKDREIEKIRNNKDVYFNTERLREMREIVWKPIREEIEKIVKEWSENTAVEEAANETEIQMQKIEPTDKTTVEKPKK